MSALHYRPSKRLRAAASLAALYAAGVTLLGIGLISTDSPRPFEMLPLFSIPAAACFGLAFVLLAAARRAGFIVLWLVVFGSWVSAASQDFGPFSAGGEFLTWSVLAAPLYAMCTIGFRRRSSRRPRWRGWMLVVLRLAWPTLAVLAIPYFAMRGHYAVHGQYLAWPSRWLLVGWLATPPAITLAGILRVYGGVPADTTAPDA